MSRVRTTTMMFYVANMTEKDTEKQHRVTQK